MLMKLPWLLQKPHVNENVSNLFQSSTSLNQLFLSIKRARTPLYVLEGIASNHENDLNQYLLCSFIHIYVKKGMKKPRWKARSGERQGTTENKRDVQSL